MSTWAWFFLLGSMANSYSLAASLGTGSANGSAFHAAMAVLSAVFLVVEVTA